MNKYCTIHFITGFLSRLAKGGKDNKLESTEKGSDKSGGTSWRQNQKLEFSELLVPVSWEAIWNKLVQPFRSRLTKVGFVSWVSGV